METFPNLTIGALPDHGELARFAANGGGQLLNISGRRAADVYPETALAPFTVHDFLFPDVFGDAPTITLMGFLRDYGQTVVAAVETLAGLLEAGERVHCFCHQGMSRSAFVSVGALVHTWNMDVDGALDLVRAKNPRARLTARGRGCLTWLEQERRRDARLLRTA